MTFLHYLVGYLDFDPTLSKPTADVKAAVGNLFIVAVGLLGLYQLIHLRFTRLIVCVVLAGIAAAFVYAPQLIQQIGTGVVNMFVSG